MATILPLPYLLGNKQTIQEMKDVVLDILFPFVLGNFVKREYVDVYSLVHADVLERLLVEFRTVHSYFHKEERYMRVCLRSLHKVFISQFFWCHLYVSFIVGAWHTHIHVIVPRQNLSPEVSAYGGPSCYEISDPCFSQTPFISERIW